MHLCIRVMFRVQTSNGNLLIGFIWYKISNQYIILNVLSTLELQLFYVLSLTVNQEVSTSFRRIYEKNINVYYVLDGSLIIMYA